MASTSASPSATSSGSSAVARHGVVEDHLARRGGRARSPIPAAGRAAARVRTTTTPPGSGELDGVVPLGRVAAAARGTARRRGGSARRAVADREVRVGPVERGAHGLVERGGGGCVHPGALPVVTWSHGSGGLQARRRAEAVEPPARHEQDHLTTVTTPGVWCRGERAHNGRPLLRARRNAPCHRSGRGPNGPRPCSRSWRRCGHRRRPCRGSPPVIDQTDCVSRFGSTQPGRTKWHV